MVKAPIGGRKKKLNASMPAIEVTMDSVKPQPAAAASTTSSMYSAAVVALTGSTQRFTVTTTISAARQTNPRPAVTAVRVISVSLE